MAIEVVMPKLGLTMTEGTISKWLKKEGDPVAKGEALLEVSTDKVTTEVESPAEGILGKILVPEGETVNVAVVIALIAAPGEKVEATAFPSTPAAGPLPEPQVIPVEPRPEAPAAKDTRGQIKASPKAKKIARERGVDLSLIRGTGPGGRIVAQDVENFTPPAKVSAPDAASPPPVVCADQDEVVEIQGMRKVIAQRMSQSAGEKPHVTLNLRVDTGALQELRQKINGHLEDTGVKVSFNDLLLKVTAVALRRHRAINAVVEGDRHILRGVVNIGLAIALDDGLVVPVVRNAAVRPLAEIAAQTRDLINRARENRLNPDEFHGGTFTLSNLGMFGIQHFTPIINPPEVAILGVGQIEKVPVVADEQVVIRPLMYLSLSFDHRVVDGAQAAQFLKTLKDLIEEPQLLWLL